MVEEAETAAGVVETWVVATAAAAREVVAAPVDRRSGTHTPRWRQSAPSVVRAAVARAAVGWVGAEREAAVATATVVGVRAVVARAMGMVTTAARVVGVIPEGLRVTE